MPPGDWWPPIGPTTGRRSSCRAMSTWCRSVTSTPGADPFVAMPSGHSVVGRGACDMKAGVAAILAAVAAAQTAGRRAALRSRLYFVIGEEDGGLGAFATLERGHRGRAASSSADDLHVITANAGALTFRIEAPGLAATACRYAGYRPSTDLPIHQALADLETRATLSSSPSMSDCPIPTRCGRPAPGR